MPIEYTRLKDTPPKLLNCPKCGSGFTRGNAFMRGMVQSTWRRFFGMPYCAIICHSCKQIVGHEK